MKYDFDTVYDRCGTDCLKYDFNAERGMPDDVLPLWIADMDFKTAPEITDALARRIAHGVFGYTDVKNHYYDAVASWYALRFGYTPSRESLFVTPGVVFALCTAIDAFTNQGDAVLIQSPVYYPFRESIRAQKRTLVDSPLVNQNGRYEIDFADFEQKICENHVKLFILCSPHNPVGRVWSQQELARIEEICVKHDVVVFADEIHSDFVFGSSRHVPFPSLSKEAERICVWGTAPTKTFNLAGLQVSDIFIADEKKRKLFKSSLDAAGCSQPGTLGLTASEAAYRSGGAWFDELHSYIKDNMQFAVDFLHEHEKRIGVRFPEGTYLMWLDCRPFGLPSSQLDDILINKAHLWLDSGRIFGREGEGFQRINAACPRKVLAQALNQFTNALNVLKTY
jgi:cystathionine beta-lyase